MQLNKHDYWGEAIPGRPEDLAYVRQIPPPIPPDRKGARILARTFQPAVYNPSEPTRDEVRKENYVRRHAQMNGQGFRSVNYEPYKAIGHPVQLDTELLVATALGLQLKGALGDGNSDDSPAGADHGQSVVPAPSKYIPRRPRKDLNTLKKEIGEGRSLMQSVKLGSGLFALLRHHWEYKVNKKERAMERERELARMSWQRTESESDSDDYAADAHPDEELRLDANIMSSYLQRNAQLNGRNGSSTHIAEASSSKVDTDAGSRSGVTFKIRPESQLQGVTDGSTSKDDPQSASDRAQSAPAAGSSRRRKRQLTARPYTPVHLNISARTPIPSSDVSDSLFNQLCVLHWLLEAMDIPESSVMTPLLTCWSLREVGGREKANRKKLEEQRQQREARFADLVKQVKLKEPTPKKGGKTGDRRPIAQWSVRSSRADSTGAAATSGSSPVGSVVGGGEPLDSLRLDESTASYHRPSADDDTSSEQLDDLELQTANGAGVFFDSKRPLSSIPESATVALETGGQKLVSAVPAVAAGPAAAVTRVGTDGRKSTTPGPKSLPPPQPQPQQQQTRGGPAAFLPTREELRQLELAKHLEEIIRCENTPMERLSSKMLRFSGQAHARASKEVDEFKASCLSNKAESLVAEGRQQWQDVKEEKALKLHDTLEQLDKHRLKNCQSKFLAMTTNASGFHRALTTMRLKSEMWRQEEQKRLNSQKDKHSLYAEWYLDLCTIATPEQRKLWYFNEIIGKLKKFGMKYHPEEKTESSSKASELKFLAVVRSLRTWEICSPDVAAAIEFCRENVIEMAADVYEEFLKNEFPSIVRSSQPSTASQKTGSVTVRDSAIA